MIHMGDLELLFRYLTFLLRVVCDMHQCLWDRCMCSHAALFFMLVMCLLEAPPVHAKHEFPTPAI